MSTGLETEPRGTAETAPRRILIVRVGAMGDVLHALPAVTALRRVLPEASIGWVVDTRWMPLLLRSDGLDAEGGRQPVWERRPGWADAREGGNRGVVDWVFPVPTQLWRSSPGSRATRRSLAELYRDLQVAAFDVAIDLQGTLRSGVIAAMSGALRRVGQRRPRERAARLFYDEEIEPRAEHVVEQAAEMVSAAVGRRIAPAAEIPLPRDPKAELWAGEQVRRAEGRPVVLLAPTAGWGAKMWPAERFGELAKRLGDEGATVLVNARREHDPVAAEVVRTSGGAARTVTSSLPELVALLRRTTLAVAGDTGPLHLAAALRRPLVALFGPTDPRRNGPWEMAAGGEESRCVVLRDATSVRDHTRRAEPDPGLLRIGVDTVFHEAMRLLDRGPERSPAVLEDSGRGR